MPARACGALIRAFSAGESFDMVNRLLKGINLLVEVCIRRLRCSIVGKYESASLVVWMVCLGVLSGIAGRSAATYLFG